MPQIRSKNSKVRYGLRPAYTPRLLKEPTAEANIPLWQRDGTVKYVTAEDLEWFVENKMADLPTVACNQVNPPSCQ